MKLVYDGQCPMCQQYIRVQRIRRDLGELELIDARDNSAARDELTRLGIDLDEGFALKIGERWYHGSEALHRLSVMSTRSGLVNRAMASLFASPERSARFYPPLKAGRNALLRLLGRAPIHNLRK
ncbi:DCC1-like thiol-disulfide oxidoreductase family protein [Halomonas korlensis]|uniref:DUF393 domain-containing protein n=1 Tax=Halomonas korlensis TaxID=463301 RepID=A0A1I7EZG7_9GAMM|nr:DCC1-like thiol-disulfide oxidoreductase family protein [Halomonas korlensis]SFU29330.1 Protein of unknown function, DUF393 [Halomonas korlensis]